jgi:hypothetical protein
MLDPLTRDAIQSRAVELLRCYLPSLKLQGRQWVTHCPFHEDATPSFVVSPEKGVFHCNGCKVGGDVLTFVQRLKRVSFPDALTEVAHRLGLVLPAGQTHYNPCKKKGLGYRGRHGFPGGGRNTHALNDVCPGGAAADDCRPPPPKRESQTPPGRPHHA